MVQELQELVKRLTHPEVKDLDVITWGSPVLTFGDIYSAKIATLGLNPSNKEFVDNYGNELEGNERRFHTLNSLGLKKWEDIQPGQLESILQLCNEYFSRNPYDNWFKRLDYLISGTSMSYYFPSSAACHLDLIPYATITKWGELSSWQKNRLLDRYGDVLGQLLSRSTIKVLILNGKSVIENFDKISDVHYEVTVMEQWSLKRKTTAVTGLAFEGTCTSVGGISLDNPIYVLGYNHNIQSSYGITAKVKQSIRKWITSKVNSYL